MSSSPFYNLWGFSNYFIVVTGPFNSKEESTKDMYDTLQVTKEGNENGNSVNLGGVLVYDDKENVPMDSKFIQNWTLTSILGGFQISIPSGVEIGPLNFEHIKKVVKNLRAFFFSLVEYENLLKLEITHEKMGDMVILKNKLYLKKLSVDDPLIENK